MKRGRLGVMRGKDRIVSGERQASFGRFMKLPWCGDPAPSITTSVKSKCLRMILELDLFWRICTWCHKKVGGAGKNHMYTTLHDPLPRRARPCSLLELHWFPPCFWTIHVDSCLKAFALADSTRTLLSQITTWLTSSPPSGLHSVVHLHSEDLLSPCWKLHPLPTNRIFYLVCLASPLEFKRARYSLSPLPNRL